MLKTNLPFSEYLALPGLNQSKLGALKSCPQKFRWLSDFTQPDTDALKIGRAIHTAVLEPDQFNASFLCLPDLDRRTKAGREAYADLVSQNAEKTLLRPDDFKMAFEVATAIRSNPHCNYLLDGAHTEISLEWHDKGTGVPCKARVDAYNEGMGMVIDLKTTIDASRSGFSKKIFSYGYHRQAAWYLEALRSQGEAAQHFVFIAVEKTPPYAVGLYRLNDDTLRLSKQENDRLLAIYSECSRTDSWPGYTQGIEDITIPDYATNSMEEMYGESV